MREIKMNRVTQEMRDRAWLKVMHYRNRALFVRIRILEKRLWG